MDLHPYSLCGGLRFAVFGVNVIGIPDHPHTAQIGSDFAQKLQPSCCEIGRNEGHAGYVTSRVMEARDKTRLNRIITYCHDDRSGARRSPDCGCDISAQGEYYIRL